MSAKDDAKPQPVTRARCPICKTPAEDGFRPFCSRRCADVDLGRWLTGGYAIAGGTTDEEAEAATEQPAANDEDDAEPGSRP
jgi:uncharacterized protein